MTASTEPEYSLQYTSPAQLLKYLREALETTSDDPVVALQKAYNVLAAAFPNRLDLSEDIATELVRSKKLYPLWPTDPLHALAVLGEEFGELTKDVLQFTYKPEKATFENLKAEAVQTAAMALRYHASLNTYNFVQGPQHLHTYNFVQGPQHLHP